MYQWAALLSPQQFCCCTLRRCSFTRSYGSAASLSCACECIRNHMDFLDVILCLVKQVAVSGTARVLAEVQPSSPLVAAAGDENSLIAALEKGESNVIVTNHLDLTAQPITIVVGPNTSSVVVRRFIHLHSRLSRCMATSVQFFCMFRQLALLFASSPCYPRRTAFPVRSKIVLRASI